MDSLSTLVKRLLAVLQEQKDQNGSHYPLPFQHLVELAGECATEINLTEILSARSFSSRTILAIRGNLLSLVAFRGDADLLAESPSLLLFLLQSTVTAENQAISLTELKKNLDRRLKESFEKNVEEKAKQGSLPEQVGGLRIKGKLHLFLWETLQTAQSTEHASAPEQESAEPIPRALNGDFSTIFWQAFDRLNQETGSHNFVSLVDLRKAVSCSVPEFDAGVQKLRQEGLLTLSAIEGRHGISQEERRAAIQEEGSLLLFVSRKNAQELPWIEIS